MAEHVAAQVWLVPVASILAALIAAAIAVWRAPRPVTREAVVDKLLRYFLLIPVGIMGLWGFVGHVFFPAQSAASIGWAPSPFQFEVGVANLGLGLAGIYAAFSRFEARVAASIPAVCFLGGAAVLHITDIVVSGNLAPGNAGPILLTDLLTPLVLIVLLVLAALKQRAKSPATLALEAELGNARKAMREYRAALEQFHKDKRNAI
jgi:hypothetical protein